MSSGLLTTSDVHSAGSSGSSTSAATAAAAKHKSAKGEERNKFKEECTTFLMTLNLLVNLCKLHLKKNSDDDEEGVKPSTSAAGDTSAAATTDETKANNVSDETKK